MVSIKRAFRVVLLSAMVLSAPFGVLVAIGLLPAQWIVYVVTPWLGAFALGLLGTVLLYVGGLAWLVAARTAPPGETGEGVVWTSGVVEPDETLTSPLGSECVAYEVRIADAGTDHDNRGYPDGRTATPFYLRGDTGRVLVDPTPRNAALEATHPGLRYAIVVGPDDSPAPGLVLEDATREAVTVEATTALADAVTSGDVEVGTPHDVEEFRLEPGHEVHVLGTATTLADRQEPAVVNRRWRPFLLTLDGRRTTLLWRTLSAVLYLLFGVAALFTAVGAVFLLGRF